MRTTLDAKQTAHYTKNGSIEFEIPHPDIAFDHPDRDQWRHKPKLQDFLLRKIGPLALTLTGKKSLRLACDQVISPENRPLKACPLKELFSIQGLILAIAIAQDPAIPPRRSPLGILPLPTSSENILFFRPELILDWPFVASPVYIALFALPNAVYIYNGKDLATNFLKQFGYNYGDVLKNETHPQIL